MKPVPKSTLRFLVRAIIRQRKGALLALFLPVLSGAANLVTAQTTPDIGVQLDKKFKIQQVATDRLASNIFRLGINARGELFASGPGYIKRLIDDDSDGIFDRSVMFSELPAQGAQGLYCDPKFILAVGDNGVWRLADDNQDSIADGPPRLMLEIGTGGEHLAHQIKPGADGWFYLLAGNQTPIRADFSQGSFSPVRFPRAGFLMRLSPDFKIQEIVAHGFRNAYDFTFNDLDQIFVYDSDDEREVGLPWYRPTRLFEIQPGDDAGWVNDGWKRPSYFFDMPQTVGEAGRGSPTAVLCYRGSSFPAEFRQAIFFADWTFGRIMVSRHDPENQTYQPPSVFAQATGQFGFAITDMVEDLDGSLLISVGGRNTSGAIYRISHQLASDNSERKSSQGTQSKSTPSQNSDSPTAKAVQNNIDSRLQELARKRTDWTKEDTLTVLKNLGSASQTSLKALIGRGEELNRQLATDPEMNSLLIQGLEASLKENDLLNLKLVYRLGLELDERVFSQIDQTRISVSAKLLIRHLQDPIGESRLSLVEAILNQIKISHDSEEALFLVRLAQLVSGDIGENSELASTRSYVLNNASSDSISADPETNTRISELIVQNIQSASSENHQELSIELGRLGACLRLSGGSLQKQLLKQISDSSIPIDDIHWLLCLSQTGPVDDHVTRKGIAMAILQLDEKIKSTETLTDRNWELRIRELVSQLMGNTPELARLVADHFSGSPEEAHLITTLPPFEQQLAAEKLGAVIDSNPDKATSNQLIALLATKTQSHQSVFRKTAMLDKLFETSVLGLARLPEEQDRLIFRRGLNSRNLNVAKNSAVALRKLKQPPEAEDFIVALFAAQRLPWTKEVHSVRDQLMQLLERHGKTQIIYQVKQPTLNQSAAIEQWADLLKEAFPQPFERLKPKESNWRETFERVDWNQGDPERGRALFDSLKCAQCHQGNLAIGPSLAGVTQRFSRGDLFQLIAEPSNRISDRYRGRVIELTDGTILSGMVIYESVDGVTLLDTSGITRRIESRDIELMRPSVQSLMPSGLLDNIKPEQWADLEAYLNKM